MKKVRKSFIIPLIGVAALSLAAIGACGVEKEAVLTLDAGAGGSIAKTEYTLSAGEDLFAYLADISPAVSQEGLTFDGWYNGSAKIAEGDLMPEEGLTLTAKYLAPYTFEVYKFDAQAGQYGAPATISGQAFWHEPFNVLGTYKIPEGMQMDPAKASTVTSASLAVDEKFSLYLRAIEPAVTFRANLPDGVEAEGSMPSEAVQYGAAFPVPTPRFVLPEDYRFAGWTLDGLDGERYFAGDTIAAVKSDFSLYAHWDRGYRDLGGGDDIIFLPSEESGRAILSRSGLGEMRGSYDGATRTFTFMFTSGETVTGRISAWDRYTFAYKQDFEEAVYTYCGQDGVKQTSVTLSVDGYFGAVFEDTAGDVTGGKGKAVGAFLPAGEEGLYRFYSDEANFYFRLDTAGKTFRIQSAEAGQYARLSGDMIDDYDLLVLDGFGGAERLTYDPAGYPAYEESGTYTILANGECKVSLEDGETFRCLIDILSGVFTLSDPDLEGEFTSEDGKLSVALDGYGDLGFATLTDLETGKSTVYAKEWEVYSLTVGGEKTLYRLLRLYDLRTDLLTRTLLFPDGSEVFREVGREAGEYFLFELQTSAFGPFILTLDGEPQGSAAGGWTLYGYTADGDETITEILASGLYTDSGNTYALTLVGAAKDDAPDPFKHSPVNVLITAVTGGSFDYIGVFVVEDTARAMTLLDGEGGPATIRVDGYGHTFYSALNGKQYDGTFALEDYDGPAPIEGADTGNDCILILQAGTGESFSFYLPNGLADKNLFYMLGEEYGTYEGGNNETFGCYLLLSGFGGEEGGFARFGATSSATSVPFVLDGIYTKVSEEYYGTVWKFEGKSFSDSAGMPTFAPDSVVFCFVLDTIADYPVFRIYREEDEVEYLGPNGESLVVTGVHTAQFTDAHGNVWTGEASRGQDLDWADGHVIAETVIFEYLGADGSYYDFTFRVDEERKTFLIQGAEVGFYYAFDPENALVVSDLCIKLDGYGGAVVYVPNAMVPEQPEAGEIRAQGSYFETPTKGIYRFISDSLYDVENGEFNFELSVFTESSSWQYAQYNVFYRYTQKREGRFINADWTTLTIDGYDRAVWVDKLGRRTEGTFEILGENVVKLKAESGNYYFSVDRTKNTFSRFEGDFVVENGVLLAYTGKATNVVLGPKIEKIGRGAFIDASIASIDLGSVTEIGVRAFDGSTVGTITGGGQVERILDQAFLYCDNLTSVNFPKAGYIGPQAFAHCYSLASVTLGEVTFIGDRAFESCYTDPLSLMPLGTFKLVLGNKTSAPKLGGPGVFAIHYSGGAYKGDIVFTVRFASVDALRAAFVHADWINGSRRSVSVGAATEVWGKTFCENVCIAEAGSEKGAWYAKDTLARLYLDGILTADGRYVGAYISDGETLTLYCYTDPAEAHEGNFVTAQATLSDGTLTGAFGTLPAADYFREGTLLTYTSAQGYGDFDLELREQFPMLGHFGGKAVPVGCEGGKAVFTLEGMRYTLTLSRDGTYTLESAPAAFNEFITAEDGSSVRITMDEAGNVTMREGTFRSVGGKEITFSVLHGCGRAEGEDIAFYFDTEIGMLENAIWRVTIEIGTTLDEASMQYIYSFTYTAEPYLALKQVADAADATRSVVFGYDDAGVLKDLWLRFSVTSVQGGIVNTYNVTGDWTEQDGGYLFYAVDGYDPVEGATFFLQPTRDASGNITSVTVSQYTREIEFEGTAADGSRIKLSSEKDAGGAAVVTVEGTFADVAGGQFTAKATGKAEFISGSTFAVYTTKEFDESKYYRILITLDALENTFTYTAAEAGKAVKSEKTTDLGEQYTVWVYSPSTSFNSTTWFFIQLETVYKGETLLLDGIAVYNNNQYPYNAEFTVTTAGDFEGRFYRMRIESGMNIRNFIALT